ncbi:uroporphyrinogen decarboxylase family protein [Paludibacter jiangxiensis]|uniref:Uroporphyrinogen decarboxylase n=1 Tax=Paludibacter jiangxiensis TaxID=681398 RepID=A0A170Z0Y8_9BACT|nr:uroporphyrinogen decarboxylase family protein [Paludibacter jiangxiensis]GAT62243.1 uroporphyrinogen decarboxylase [Paludibacter jiangxiensis]
MSFKSNPLLGNKILPVDIVLAPEWWNKNEGITFDRDFFFNPLKRVEEEQHKEKVLYDRWGKYGLGEYRNEARPEIGAVHLASGFLLSEMLGCTVNYTDSHPPQVVALHADALEIDVEKAFASEPFQRLEKLVAALKEKYGYLTGDINWGGILNLALDVRGENIFIDMMMTPDEVKEYFDKIAQVIERFTTYVQNLTGTSSISVTRNVRLLKEPVLLHSECSHTMISEADYEEFLLPYDVKWSARRPYGVHYCGPDPHRMAASFAKIPHLDFLDLGWGGDVKLLREHLPETMFSIRLSPVELAKQSHDEIRGHITRLVHDSGNPYLTAVCCINMDDSVTDDKIDVIFETVEELRKEYSAGK